MPIHGGPGATHMITRDIRRESWNHAAAVLEFCGQGGAEATVETAENYSRNSISTRMLPTSRTSSRKE